MYDVVFEPIVDKQFEDIATYIGRDNPLRAISFIEEMQRKILSLSENPKRFQTIGLYRRLVHGNYVALYSIDERNKRVVVKFVGEGHQNWGRRV